MRREAPQECRPWRVGAGFRRGNGVPSVCGNNLFVTPIFDTLPSPHWAIVSLRFFFFFAPPCTNAGHNLFNNLVKVGRVTALRSSQVCVVGGSVAVKPGYAMGVRLWRCVFSVCRFKSGLSAEDFISMCRCRQHTCRLHISPLTSVCLFSMSVVLGVHEGASFAVTDIFVVCIYSEVDFFFFFFKYRLFQSL